MHFCSSLRLPKKPGNGAPIFLVFAEWAMAPRHLGHTVDEAKENAMLLKDKVVSVTERARPVLESEAGK
jgi:hypothetical protein